MSSRKEQKEQLKQERLAREAQRKAAEARRRRLGIVLGGALAVIAVAIVVVALVSGGGDGGGGAQDEEAATVYPDGGEVPERREENLAAAVEAAGCELQLDLEEEGREHIAGPNENYRTNPPTSGDHANDPASDGLYGESPSKEALVHTLEHGRVIIQFDPDRASEELRANLKALFDEDDYHVVLTPNNTDMRALVAASAWRNLLTCPEVNDRTFDALRAFTQRLRDRAPERVP